MYKQFGDGGSQFNQFDLNNMMGRMLGHSMRVSGVDQAGDGVRQVMRRRMSADDIYASQAAEAKAREEYRAKHNASVNSPENQAWLASLTPENRRIYKLMQRY
jgi:hypothetical protein